MYTTCMILGIDEAGRGPWAGPLVVGACILGGIELEGLTDSKKLSAKKRLELDAHIRMHAKAFGLGWVHAPEIDAVGIAEALRLATRRAVEQVDAPYTEIIIDGTQNFLQGTRKGSHVQTMKKADLLVPSVSAASILAKVARDAYMHAQDAKYPGYGFKSHVGYGTARHMHALQELGPTPLHRMSYKPLAKLDRPNSTKERALTSGQEAEQKVTNLLENEGHKILARNWRNKYAEIDIVSMYADSIYFTEVKYRKNDVWGSGLDAITPRKVAQMRRAAVHYMHAHTLPAERMQLAAAYVSGVDFKVEDWFAI